MNASDYQRLSGRSRAGASSGLNRRLVANRDLIHAVNGIATEAGEFADPLKKHLFYGRELDTANMTEELGDLLWYVALACDALGVDMGKVMAQNVEKLRVRYTVKFTEQEAEARNDK